MAQKVMYPGMVNSPETTITNNINESDTIIYVLDPARVPEPPNLMTLGTGTNAETVKVTAVNDNALTVERGFQGIAKSWPAGTVIARNFTEYDYNALKENIEDLEATKETPQGAQEKADAALNSAKQYTDQEVGEVSQALAAHKADYAKYVAQPLYNVKGFGAVGDGVTDDTAAIQAAVDAAVATGGGTIYFPKPAVSYLISSPININGSNITLLSLEGAKIKAKTDVHIIRAYRVNNIAIIGLEIEGWANEEGFTRYPGNQNGVTIGQCSHVYIKNCKIEYCSSAGIIITGKHLDATYNPDATHYVWVDGNFINWCNQGITLIEGAKDIFVTNNIIEYSNTWGIGVDDMSSNDVEAHICERVVISKNILRFNGMTGTTVQGSIVVAGSQFVEITENQIYDAGQGTYVDDVNQTSSVHGILVSSGGLQSNNVAKHCIVSKNIIVRPSRIGISLVGAEHLKVFGNLILNSGYRIPAGAREAIQIISQTLQNASIQGANYNEIYNNTIIKESADSDIDYGIRIYDTNCVGNIIHDEYYFGITSLAITGTGTGTRITRVFLDGVNVADANTTDKRPIAPFTGQIYFDTTLGKNIVWNGSAWVNVDGTPL